MYLNYPQKSNGMYYLKRTDMDDIAMQYLKEYMPSVLNRTQPVDVQYLAEDVCYLTIIKKPITIDQSVLGLVAFGDIELQLYDIMYHKVVENIQEGTIVIDPCLCNSERYRYTLAHELAHWLLHRSYHSPTNQQFQLRINGSCMGRYVACRTNDIENSKKRALTTDSDWEEWQADCLAASLLMPIDTFDFAAKQALLNAGVSTPYLYFGKNKYTEYEVKRNLAHLFRVSLTAVEIRLKHLNFFRSMNECVFAY